MEISCSQLRNAKDTLDYISSIKQETEALLFSKTRLLYSGIALSEEEYSHAIQCISEVIDDLFHRELRECHHFIATWQQQDNRRTESEWRGRTE